MGRQFFLVIALSVLLLESGLAQGQQQRPQRRGMSARPAQLRGPPAGLHFGPEDRQMFQRNAQRWLQMDAQQQQILRERERTRQQQIRSEVEAAMRQSGLRLDEKGRQEFEIRYRQERRRLERSLREEFESKRQQELPQLNERLKKEFQIHSGSGSPSASPAK